MMKKRLAASLLAGILVAGLTFNSASAASVTGTTVTGTGSGTIYSPKDIIDVVVPTDFKIAFNPLKVSIPADEGGSGLTGAKQILSGTYAIQNRSTVPVNVSAKFTVKGDATAVAGSAKAVQNAEQADPSKAVATFSLDLVTTAKGSAQALAGTVADNTDSKQMRGDVATSGVKITKTSTKAIALTDVDTAVAAPAAKDVNFMLAAGPYVAKYDKQTHTVTYQEDTKGTFDAVAFTFTGTTTTNTAKWAAAKAAPTVTATYTLTESTATAYESQAFDPFSKAVTLKTGDTDTKVTASAAGTYAFKTTPVFTMNAENTAIDYAKNKVTVLSLTPNAKADSSKSMEDLGITVSGDADAGYTASIAAGIDLDAGFYQFTVARETFTVEVQK